MKCPKCGYLGFEHVERCRNCGYDFSLMPAQDVAGEDDLPIRTEAPAESSDSLDDLTLIDAAMAPPLVPWQLAADGERSFSASNRDRAPSKLPLFSREAADDLPLITKPSPPRPPLAVRRATPEVPRMRTEVPRTSLLDLSAPTASSGAATSESTIARSRPDEWSEGSAESDDDTAALAARIVAATVDLAILAAIDAVVVYFTMQICGLSFADLNILPKVPLAAFLVLQNGGYLVAFTAGGQTLGKMAAGIRVVSTRDDTLDVGRALLRTFVWTVLAVPAGLGFATALFSRERRGLHDYCAGTRVVRAV